MTPHACLSCGGEIADGQEETEVPQRSGASRFVHVSYRDCQAELAGVSAIGSALRSHRIRQRGGRVPPHQSVSQQEMRD